VRFSLPDNDVFTIDAAAATPASTSSVAHVGTVLFNMAVNPVPRIVGGTPQNVVYVSNTEAHNEVRFEGPGNNGATTVQGHLHEARITTVIGSSVTPRRLNTHIDYSVRPAPAGTAAKSLATPTALAVTSDGQTIYVAAFGWTQTVDVPGTKIKFELVALPGGKATIGSPVDEAGRKDDEKRREVTLQPFWLGAREVTWKEFNAYRYGKDLDGITRQSLITLAREDLDIPFVERPIGRTELYVADEVFLCGTGAEVTAEARAAADRLLAAG
jgi:hypothetical protein